MPSKSPVDAYVWIWLPGETDPVVAGRIQKEESGYSFLYGQSYLARNNKIAISEAELPLRTGKQFPPRGLGLAGCLRDGAPDAWGRRVILNKLTGTKGRDAETSDLDELTYFLESGSDRIGALDFQRSSKDYMARHSEGASLEELVSSAERVEEGIPLSQELDHALQQGSSVGGARPKALVSHDETRYIAKFSLQSDTFNVVKGEYVAMRLAAMCGLDVAPVKLTKAMNKDVLLIQRFDREKIGNGWTRRSMLSALTLLQLDEMMARYASYEELAELIRKEFSNPKAALKELFARLVFNILCGNNDDHARNHAAFWNGNELSLTPAYDICPQNRTGREASQAMFITGQNRSSTIASCVLAHTHFLIDRRCAIQIINQQIDVIQSGWKDICEEAELNEVERSFFWKRQFLNPFALDGYQSSLDSRIP